MVQIKIEEVIDHLQSEMKRALEGAVIELMPNAQFDRNALYRSFQKHVRRKCRTWENVPDRYVEK